MKAWPVLALVVGAGACAGGASIPPAPPPEQGQGQGSPEQGLDGANGSSSGGDAGQAVVVVTPSGGTSSGVRGLVLVKTSSCGPQQPNLPVCDDTGSRPAPEASLVSVYPTSIECNGTGGGPFWTERPPDGAPIASAESGETDGTFVIDVPPGSYLVAVGAIKPGVANVLNRCVDVAAGKYASITFERLAP
jgi:hypothetical protein